MIRVSRRSECDRPLWMGIIRLVLALLILARGVPQVAHAGIEARCELLPKKTRVLVCEPLIADLRLTNTGTQNIFVPAGASLERGSVQLTYTRPDGNKRRYEPLARKHSSAQDEPVGIAPGASYYSRLFLSYTSDIGYEVPSEYLFETAGTYCLQASIWVSDQPSQGNVVTVESKPIEVVAVEPTDEDAEGLRLFRGKEQALALYWGERPAGEKLGEFEALISRYPQSIYAQYVLYRRLVFALAEDGFYFSLPGREVPERLRAPFEQLKAFAQTYPDFPAVDELLLYLAKCYDGASERDRADALRAEILRKFPQSAVAAQLHSGRQITAGSVSGIVKD